MRPPTPTPRGGALLRWTTLVFAAVLVASACTSASSVESVRATPSTATDGTADSAISELASPASDEPVIELGAAPGRRSAQVPIDALVGVEQLIDRQLDVVRTYSFWDDEFPDLREQWAAADGRAIHISINARRQDDSIVRWRDIAEAPEGSDLHGELIRWVDAIAAFDGDLRVTFHHEADIEPEFGTPDDFVAAWQRFATLLDEAAPDVPLVWVMTLFTIADAPAAERFWPGDDVVDVIAADGFNWFGCRGEAEAWRAPAELLDPLVAFGEAHPGKPLMFAELGSDEDPDDPTRKAAWIDELAELMTTDPAYAGIETIVWFHNDHDEPGSTCDWWLDSSEATSVAFAALAARPEFGGAVAAAAPVSCPIVATTYSLPSDLAVVDGDGDGRYDFEFGEQNRFVGIGDQSNDGADHRVNLRFDPIADVPRDATVELRVRVGERQPALPSPVQVVAIDPAPLSREVFAETGEMLEPAWFDASTPGGHHVLDVTALLDPGDTNWVRLQLETPPPAGDGKAALFIGTGNASRTIDRPALVVRSCS